jgi:hypothetical protein
MACCPHCGGLLQSKKRVALTQSRLKELLDYNPKTGVFIWRVDRGSKYKAGDVAGSVKPRGVSHIGVDGRPHFAHVLAWLYMAGKYPEGLIDHEDGNPSNNRWKNLREATHAQNGANVGLRKDNTSGFKGVRFRYGKWRASIKTQDRRLHLGTFDTAEEACAAYHKAAEELHGDFARLH